MGLKNVPPWLPNRSISAPGVRVLVSGAVAQPSFGGQETVALGLAHWIHVGTRSLRRVAGKSGGAPSCAWAAAIGPAKASASNAERSQAFMGACAFPSIAVAGPFATGGSASLRARL